MLKQQKRLKEKLDRGECVIGTHSFSGVPMLTEAMALCGFDAVWIDMEHTVIDKAAVINNLIACNEAGAAAVVRIPWNDPVMAKPILDMGADAIIFPYIRTVEDAKLAAAACTYPPEGIRGYGPQRANCYGLMDQLEYVHRDYRAALRFIQLEHIDALKCLEGILQVEGIDGFIFGPNDLAGSIGLIGQPRHEKALEITKRATEVLRKAGKPFGTSVGYDEETLAWWRNEGATLLFAGYDTGYVMEGAQKTFAGMRMIAKGESK